MTPLETLRALGTGNEPSAEAKQRVSNALFAALETAAATATAASVAKHSVAPSGPAVAAPLLGGAVGSKALAVAAGIWLLGGVTGAAIYRVLGPHELRVVYVDRPAAAVAPVAPVAPSAGPNPELPGPSVALPPPSVVATTRATERPSVSAAPEGGSW